MMYLVRENWARVRTWREAPLVIRNYYWRHLFFGHDDGDAPLQLFTRDDPIRLGGFDARPGVYEHYDAP